MKIRNLICIIIILLCSAFYTVSATETNSLISFGTLSNNVSWELTLDGNLRIYGNDVIPEYAFEEYPWDIYGDSIKNVTIESGITQIPNDLFNHKEQIETIKISDTVDLIGDNAFFYCTNLKQIIVDDNNLAYSSKDGVLFNKDYSILVCYPAGVETTVYTLPNTVTELMNNSIAYNNYLLEINLGDGLIAYNNSALLGCENLEKLHIGKNLSSIDSLSFTYCDNLSEITVSDDNISFSSVDGVLFNKDKTQLLRYPINKKGAYTIPDNVVSVGKSAFHSSQGLTSIDTGNTLKSISTFGFHSCKNLERITIRNSVVTLERMAFYRCTSLTDITIQEGLLSIGKTAFEGCTALESISIPASVISIDDYAFYQCTALMNIYVNDGNEIYVDIDGILFTKDYSAIVCYPAGKIETKYIVPQSVLKINDSAFAHNYNLEDVVLPNELTYLGKQAFVHCTALKRINFPERLTTINSYTFYCCESLEGIELHQNITFLGDCAFGNCTNMKFLKWDNNICELEQMVFFACDSLTEVYITDLNKWLQSTFTVFHSNPMNNGADLFVNNEKITEIDFTKYYPNIPQNAFCGCTSIEKIISNIDIGASAFNWCINLKDVVLKNGVEQINDHIFSCCENLSTVTIPYSVNYIDEYAFWSCYKLKNINYYGNANSWANLVTTSGTLPYGVKINYLLSIDATWINGEVVVDCSQSIKNKTLIIASYNENVFNDIYIKLIDNDNLCQTTPFTAPVNNNIKIFVWDSLTNCKPCCSSIFIDKQVIMSEEEIRQKEFLRIYAEEGILAAIQSGLYESENTAYFLKYPKYAIIVDEEYPTATTIEQLEKFMSEAIEFSKPTQGAGGGMAT